MKAKVVYRELVVSRCDPPTLLDLVEEPARPSFALVQIWAEALCGSVSEEIRPCAVLAHKRPDPIRVKPTISEQHCSRFQRSLQGGNERRR